jgi:ATP synthase protein I
MPAKHPKHGESTSKALARWNNEGGAPSTGDASTRKPPKRPLDLNQRAKRMVRIASGKALGRQVTMDRTVGSKSSSPDNSRASDDPRLRERLHALERRLEEMRPARDSDRNQMLESNRAGLTMALRLGAEFVAGVVVGAAIGWGVDKLFGTSPWGLIVFVILGFSAGVLTVMRSARALMARPAGSNDLSRRV